MRRSNSGFYFYFVYEPLDEFVLDHKTSGYLGILIGLNRHKQNLSKLKDPSKINTEYKYVIF